jgi:4-hydroxy 2-oxovalerate aldolase
VNNFSFSDDFVKDLYRTNIKAGVDYMEFGYKASKDVFNREEHGKWKFCEEEDIRAVVGDNHSGLKISVMADVGFADFKKDIINKKDSVIDMVRTAAYIPQIPDSVEMIQDAHDKGYETTVNIMAISKVREEDLEEGLRILAESDVDYIYLVDSFGAFYPDQIRRLTDKYMNIAQAHGKRIGIHAHNNQQLAFANTIEALNNGASMLDATVSGMGRGAGNCYMETLLAFLRNSKYNLVPIMDFVQKHIKAEMEKGNIWGYDIPYLLTGVMNAHPSSAIRFMQDKRVDYSGFYRELKDSKE